MRFTMNEMLRSIAISHPPGKRCSSIRGNSGYRNTDIASRAIPLSTNARYWSEAVSIAWWINNPAESSAAIIAKEMIPAPPIAKATGKPVMIPPNSVRNTIIRPISIPSNPKIILFSFLQARLAWILMARCMQGLSLCILRIKVTIFISTFLALDIFEKGAPEHRQRMDENHDAEDDQ